MNDFNVVIPARYGSQRLPAKMLALIADKPIVVHTANRAMASGAHNVIVATDDERIIEVCESHGIRAMMTSTEHCSGTDRIAEVALRLGWAPDDIVINVQGDEPFVDPDNIDQVAQLVRNTDTQIATLACKFDHPDHVNDSNSVKVVRNLRNHALYFSRAAIPFARDQYDKTLEPLRHIGLYGYKVASLINFTVLEICDLEHTEKLEQLRALWHGWTVTVAEAVKPPIAGVDTHEDLKRANDYYCQIQGG